MGLDTIRETLGELQVDAASADAWEKLHTEVASVEPSSSDGNALAKLLHAAREAHARRGEWEAVAKLLPLEIAQHEVSARQPLLMELARVQQQELFDEAAAVETYEQVLDLVPDDELSQAALAESQERRGSWKVMAETYAAEAEQAPDDVYKASMLMRAAEVELRFGGDEQESERVLALLAEATEADPANLTVLSMLERVYRRSSDYKALISVLERWIKNSTETEQKVAAGIRLARIFRHRLNDSSGAALAYENVLDVDVSNHEAVEWLVEHYSSTENWDRLVHLYERELQHQDLSRAERVGEMLQIAMLHYRKRQNLADAASWFERVRAVDPTNGAMLAFFREYCSANGDEALLLQVLQGAQRVLSSGREKAAITQEIAQLAESQQDAQKAIEQYKALLRQDADNEDARNALKSLYRKTQGYNQLVDLLRHELERLAEDDKENRLAILREVAAIYREHIPNETSLVSALNQILQVDDKDIGAVRELIGLYEKLERWRDLLTHQQRLAALSDDAEERVRLLRAAGRRWLSQFNNVQNATGSFEALLEIAPQDREARDTLAELYKKRRAWPALYNLYKGEVESLSGAQQIAVLKEMAKLCGERLGDAEGAAVLHKRILEAEPGNLAILDALEKQAERSKDWETLADALERRARAGLEPKAQITVLQKLGSVYEDQLKDLSRAASAWRRVLELEHGHSRAIRTLRDIFLATEDFQALDELYTSQNDFEGLAEVLSNAADKASDIRSKVDLSYRAAAVYEERLHQPERAFRSYERILAADPMDTRAARGLAPLYEADEKWARLPALYDLLLSETSDRHERLALYRRLVEITSKRLSDRAAAVAYAQKAHEVDPENFETLELFEESCREAGTWEPFVDALEASLKVHRDSGAPPPSGRPSSQPKGRKRRGRKQDQKATSAKPTAANGQTLSSETVARLELKLALTYDQQLGRIDDAVTVYKRLLSDDPHNDSALAQCEALLRRQNRRDDLRWLLGLRVEHAPDDAAAVNVIKQWAQLEEEAFGDVPRASDLYQRVIERSPGDEVALRELPRLLLVQGEAAGAVHVLLQRRDSLAGAERAKVEAELAEVYLERLEQPEQALEAAKRTVELEAELPRAIDVLQRLSHVAATRHEASEVLASVYHKTGESKREGDALVALLAAEKDVPRRHELYQRIVNVYEQLGSFNSAFEVILKACHEFPQELVFWDRANGLSAQAGRPSELADVYREVLQADLTAEVQQQLCERAALLVEEQLGDPQGATPYLEKILKLDPGNQGAFFKLKQILTSAERWGELQALYDRTADAVDDPETRVEILGEVAMICEEFIEDPTSAMNYYEKMLEVVPDQEGALAALDRLYSEHKKHPDLERILEKRLVAASHADEIIQFRLRLAELQLTELHLPEKALKNVEEVLLEDVTSVEARQLAERILEVGTLRGATAVVLERVYESRDDIRDLSRVLQVRIDVAQAQGESKDELRSLLHRLARLKTDRLRDDAGALEVWAEYLPLAPEDVEARRELLTVCERLGEFDKAAAILMRAAEAAADESRLAGEIVLSAAQVLDERLAKADDAEKAYRKVITIAPDDAELVVPAARALERLYQSAERYFELVEMLKTELDLLTDGEKRAELLARIALLSEEKLSDLDAAVRAWKSRMDYIPDDKEALVSLDRLYERSERWPELARTLEIRRDHTVEPDARRELYRRSYRLLATKLDKVPQAIDTCRALLDEFGPEAETLIELEGLLRKAERFEELAEVLEMHLDLAESTQQRLDLLTEMGNLQSNKLSDPVAALESFKNVVAQDPGHKQARSALEALLENEEPAIRLEAAETLQAVYEGEGSNEKLLAVLLIVADNNDDPVERLEVFKRAIAVVDGPLNDAERAFELALRAVRQAAGHVDLEPWLDELERLAQATGRRKEQVATLRAVVDEIFDGDIQYRVMMKVAVLARDQLQEPALALEYFKRASEARVDSDEALLSLEQLYTEQEDYQALLDVLERRTELTQDDTEKKDFLLRRGALLEGPLEAADRAASVYERALELGFEERTITALVKLYTREKRWQDLVDLHQRRLDEGQDDAAILRVAIARIAANNLGDVYRAFDELEAALKAGAQVPEAVAELERLMTAPGEPEQHARAAALLEPIYLQRSDYDQVMQTLRARLEHAQGDERRDLLQRLAQLNEEQKEDYSAALETIALLFHEDTTDSRVAAELERLAKVADSPLRLAEIYSKELEKVELDDAASAHMARRAGELYRELGDLDKALVYYRRALAFEPENRELFAAEDAILERLDRHQERVELYRTALDHFFEPDDRMKFLHTIAKLQMEKLGQKDEAIATYVEALEIKDDDPHALDTLSRLYYETKRFEDLYELVLRRAEAAPNQNHAVAYRLALARLCRDELRDGTRAVEQLEAIVEVQPAHKEALEELEAFRKNPEQRARVVEILLPLYERADEWRRVIKLNEDRFQLAQDVVEKVNVLKETAELWEKRGNDPRKACQGLAAAVSLDPEDPDVRSEYERLVEATGAWDALAQLYQGILDERPELSGVAEIWSKLARVHDGPRNDPRAALLAFSKLRELDDTELFPIERMEALATLLSDWETLDEVLLAKADLVLDDEERASIWRRIGEGRRDMLARPDGAIEAYERALEFEADNAFTVDCLIELYEQQEKWEQLVELYQRRVDLTEPDDDDLRYELLVAAATVHEKQFQDRLRAIEFLVQALDTKPNDAAVLVRLGALYEKEHQWPELLDNLKARAAIAENAEARAGFHRDMGDLLAQKLESFDEALEAYEEVLNEVPSDPGARNAVRGIGQEHEELRERVASILLPALQNARLFEDVVEVLELRLSVESDNVDRAQTLRTMARVLETELNDAARSHAALLRAMAEVPEDPSVHAEVERLCEGEAKETRWGAYADALTERAQTTFEADLAKELYSRLGQIAEERLNDRDRAIDAYTRAVDQVGDQPEILHALDRLYTDMSRWSELIDVLDRLAPLVESDSERAELHYRAAVVQIDHFAEAGQGLAELRTALELDSRHEAAAKKLEALTDRRDLFEEAAEVLESVYRSRGSLDDLAKLSEKRVEFAETPGERIEMRKALAQVLEDEMGNVQAAQRVLQQGLKDDPSDAGLLDDLERLAGMTGDWSSAGAALKNAIEQSPDLAPLTGKELCLRLADWFTDRANDPDAAEQALEKAFAYDDTADDVLMRLEDLQSAPGKELRKIETLRRRARLQFDEAERETLSRTAFELARSKNSTELMEAISRELIKHDDANRWALAELVELRAAANDHEETYGLLLRLAEVSLDASELSALRYRAANIARQHLEERAKAAELLEKIFEDDPLDMKAAAALRELYPELDRYEELASLLERLAEIVDSPTERSTLRLELAEMQLSRFKSIDRATETLNAVLDEDPGNSEAVVLLSRLYEAEGRDQELAELLNAQIAAARERGDRDAELRFEVRLAEIYDSKLGDKNRAIEAYRRVVEREPGHRDALAALVRLYKATSQLAEAADTLATIVEQSEGDERLGSLKELSATYLELKDTEKAIQCLEIALEQSASDKEVRDGLRRLYRDNAAWEKLGELLAADAGYQTDDTERVATLREAAQIFSTRTDNHRRAAQLLEQAVELKSDDRGLLMLLCEQYNKSGRGKDAVAVLEKIVESYGGRRSKELADVHRQLASAYQSDGNPERAVEELEKAFRIEPGNISVLRDLGLLCLETGNLSRAQQMFRALLLQKLNEQSPITKAQVFYYLAVVHQRLDEKPRAVQMLERALQADSGFAEAEQLLAELRA